MSLLAALSLSTALSERWKSSAPGEASAALPLMEGHCTLLCHSGHRAVWHRCPQYYQCVSAVVWDGGWVRPGASSLGEQAVGWAGLGVRTLAEK